MNSGIVKKLMSKMPKCLTGAEDEMDRKLRAAFGDRDFSAEIGIEKQKNAGNWLIICGMLIVLAGVIFIQSRQPIDYLERVMRPDYTGETDRIGAEVKAVYGSGETVQDVQIFVHPKNLEEQEKIAYMKKTLERLPQLILGENESLDNIVTDMNLAEIDPETNVSITWHSDNPEILDERGILNPVTAGAGEEVKLDARLVLLDTMETVEITVKLGEPTAEKLAFGLERLLAGEIRKLNDSKEGSELVLPEQDDYGVAYLWKVSRKNYYPALALALIMLGILLYKSRYSGVEKRIKTARESMIRDFPEFINKLLILLNAGLVVHSAIGRITEDYEEQGGKKRALYEELALIKRRVESTNASFATELNSFAARSSVREIMRFSAIVSDNIDKGSSLADKLRSEGDLVWLARRKRAEEAGRLAETKLVMPMALILLVLIMITVAPAALSM